MRKEISGVKTDLCLRVIITLTLTALVNDVKCANKLTTISDF